jgi:hypothetical protein
MRKCAIACLTLVILAGLSSRAQAQSARVTIDRVQVGFRSNANANASPHFKQGMWTPVFVDVTAGPEGLPKGNLVIETVDCDDVDTRYTVPTPALQKNEQATFIGYTKPITPGPRIKATLEVADLKISEDQTYSALDLGESLYLTLGAYSPDLVEAVKPAAGKQNDQFSPHHAVCLAYEKVPAGHLTPPQPLPDRWFGYDGLDLVILLTENKDLLERLSDHEKELRALTEWVRRGGRLVVSVSLRNLPEVRKVLESPAWQPRLPDRKPDAVLLPKDRGKATIQSLQCLITWAGMLARNPNVENIEIAPLEARGLEVLAHEAAGADEGNADTPVMVRFPHGLGSVTVIALSLEMPPMKTWGVADRTEFWRKLYEKLAPRNLTHKADLRPQINRRGETQTFDLGTELERELDKFNVPNISFGWVALFILLYILIVGPLDYFLLKKVFKRLEWTWITFPTVVLVVSAAAYFIAYTVKGNDLKVNKVDLVDFDLRTDPKGTYVHGTTWFTLLSPRIQNYTVGIEPVLSDWCKCPVADGSRDYSVIISWMGRPENSGLNSIGRPRSQTLSSRPYKYEENARGLRLVPIPVWSTKSFTASWERFLKQQPVTAELHYSPPPADVEQLRGRIKSHLPFDLVDVGVLFGSKWFPLEGPLKANQELLLKDLTAEDVVQNFAVGSSRFFDPTVPIKRLMFHERIDQNNSWRNHAFRRLDQSWRLMKDSQIIPVRDAILYGRIKRLDDKVGGADEVNRDARNPTRLWLEILPGDRDSEGKPLPLRELRGMMVQDTYVRIILPVTMKKQPQQ